MTKRYLVLGHEYDDAAIIGSWSLVDHYSNDCTDCIICVSSIQNLSDSTSFTRNIGNSISAALCKGKPVYLSNSKNYILAKTTRTIKKVNLSNTAVLAMYADQDMLDLLDSKNPRIIVAMPWQEGVIDGWISSWAPETYTAKRDDNNQIQIEPVFNDEIDLIADAVVEKALKSMLAIIHTKSYSSFARKADSDYARKCFGVLRKKKHDIDPVAIRSWVVRQGYTPGLADEVQKIAEKVNGLKNNPKIPREEVNRIYDYFNS